MLHWCSIWPLPIHKGPLHHHLRPAPAPPLLLGDQRDPCCTFWEDLVAAVCTWKANHEQIILYSDANKSARCGPLNQQLHTLGLRDALTTTNPDLTEPYTWFCGSQQIKSVWILENIAVSSCCFLPFSFGIGNHRGILLYVPIQCLLG